jgi:hypothetical protein
MRVIYQCIKMNGKPNWWLLMPLDVDHVDFVEYALVVTGVLRQCSRHWKDYYSHLEASSHYDFHSWKT